MNALGAIKRSKVKQNNIWSWLFAVSRSSLLHWSELYPRLSAAMCYNIFATVISYLITWTKRLRKKTITNECMRDKNSSFHYFPNASRFYMALYCILRSLSLLYSGSMKFNVLCAVICFFFPRLSLCSFWAFSDVLQFLLLIAGEKGVKCISETI